MKFFSAFFFLLFSIVMFSQEQEAWVYFNDKPSAQTYLNSPLLMLSQRSLDRRANQNIALNLSDVPVETAYIDQIKVSTGITVMAQSKWLNALHIRGTQSDITSLKNLAFVDKVVFANRNLNTTSKRVTENKIAQSNDKLNATVNYAYGASQNQIQMLNGQVLHQQNYTGSGKIIAVLDAGFPGVNTAQPFQNLINNNRILGGYDYVSRNPNFYAGDSHGTKVLSTMGGYKENQLIGTAPEASYYLYITENDAIESPVEESLWVEAAEEADRVGVDIITTSLGYFGGFTDPNYNHTYNDMNGTTNFISKGAEIAFSKGIIVVASAGNEGNQTENHIGSPADAVSVITVGSVTAAKAKSSFSSVGPSFDNRIKPDVMAQGSGTTISDTSGNIGVSDGTSFSGPVMAGMIACLWQAFPMKTNQEIRQMILQSSDKFSTPDNNFGYGIPNFGSALNVEIFKETGFTVYPNPGNNNITFIFPDKIKTASVVLYSVLGQKVMEKEVSNQNPVLSIQNLKSGLYFYVFDADGIHKTGKIIKQ